MIVRVHPVIIAVSRREFTDKKTSGQADASIENHAFSFEDLPKKLQKQFRKIGGDFKKSEKIEEPKTLKDFKKIFDVLINEKNSPP